MSLQSFLLLKFIGSLCISSTQATTTSSECKDNVDNFIQNTTWYLASWVISQDQFSRVKALLKDSMIIEQRFRMNCNDMMRVPYYIFWQINHEEPFKVWADVIEDDFNLGSRPIGTLEELEPKWNLLGLKILAGMPLKIPAKSGQFPNSPIDRDEDQNHTMYTKYCWRLHHFLVRNDSTLNYNETYVAFTSSKFYQYGEEWMRALGYTFKQFSNQFMDSTKWLRFQNYTKCFVGKKPIPSNKSYHSTITLLSVLAVVGASLTGVLVYYCYSQRPDNRVYPIILISLL